MKTCTRQVLPGCSTYQNTGAQYDMIMSESTELQPGCTRTPCTKSMRWAGWDCWEQRYPAEFGCRPRRSPFVAGSLHPTSSGSGGQIRTWKEIILTCVFQGTGCSRRTSAVATWGAKKYDANSTSRGSSRKDRGIMANTMRIPNRMFSPKGVRAFSWTPAKWLQRSGISLSLG